jgi:hypothetical protein
LEARGDAVNGGDEEAVFETVGVLLFVIEAVVVFVVVDEREAREEAATERERVVVLVDVLEAVAVGLFATKRLSPGSDTFASMALCATASIRCCSALSSAADAPATAATAAPPHPQNKVKTRRRRRRACSIAAQSAEGGEGGTTSLQVWGKTRVVLGG